MKGGSKRPRSSLWGKQKKSDNKSRSNRHEKRLENPLKAKAQPNSGAGRFIFSKGDLTNENFVYQAKLCAGGKISLDVRVIAEVCRQASMTGKNPAIVITLEGMPENLPADWVAVPAHVHNSMLGEEE